MPDIEVEVHGERMPAYLATPADQPRAGGVVLIHEIFGLNKSMRATADRFAEAGFLTICPDLTWRLGKTEELEPGSEQALEEGRRRMARTDRRPDARRHQGRRAASARDGGMQRTRRDGRVTAWAAALRG